MLVLLSSILHTKENRPSYIDGQKRELTHSFNKFIHIKWSANKQKSPVHKIINDDLCSYPKLTVEEIFRMASAQMVCKSIFMINFVAVDYELFESVELNSLNLISLQM
jgi:hypothetical protein